MNSEKLTITRGDLSEVIRESAKTAALEAAAEIRRAGSGGVNYFKATESLLWNYKRLERLVDDQATYMDTFVQHRSKSIVKMGSGGGSAAMETDDDLLETLLASRRESYAETCSRFQEVDAVIALFREEPEWPVIGMYYMNEDRHGHDRDSMEPRWTWETIALELEISEKTARRWRSKIVRNMSVVMFGLPAAVSAGIEHQKQFGGLQMSGSVPEGDLDAPV